MAEPPDPPSTRAALAALRIELAVFRRATRRELEKLRAEIARKSKHERVAVAVATALGALGALAKMLLE